MRIDETRIFHQLFKSENPAAAKPDFKADINPNSLEVIKGGMVEVGFWTVAKRALAEARAEREENIARSCVSILVWLLPKEVTVGIFST